MDDLLKNGTILIVVGFLAKNLSEVKSQIWKFLKRFICVTAVMRENCYLNYEIKAFVRKQKPLIEPKRYSPSDMRVIEIAPGSHWFWYEGKPCRYFYGLRKLENAIGGQNTESETITLDFFFSDREVISRFFDSAAFYVKDAHNQEVQIFFPCAIGGWDCVVQPKRSISTVYMANSIKADIVDDIKFFKSSKPWYDKRGIPYRRGYMLSGPPGNGKTSLIKAIASEFNMDIRVLYLNREKITEDVILGWLSYVKNSIILIEDVDCLFNKRESKGGLSFSGLLNVLDGVASSNSNILFMTTNHIESLDPALIRPGRIDRIFQINNPDSSQAIEYFKAFYELSQDDLNNIDGAGELGVYVENTNLSMAKFQEILLECKNSPVDAVKRLKGLNALANVA